MSTGRPSPADEEEVRKPFLARLLRTDPVQRLTAVLLRGFLNAVHLLGQKRAERFAIALCTRLGPLTSDHAVAKRNLALVFPEKSEAERATILRGTWENLARTLVEFVFLDEIVATFDGDRPGEPGQRLVVTGVDQFMSLRDDGKPGIVFAAHLGNWEMLAVAAKHFGLTMTVPFLPPNNRYVGEELLGRRRALMGELVPAGPGAIFAMAAALDRGEHFGMLADQRLRIGPLIPFFGRPAHTNPLVARFARRFDCPVHGARAVRLPDGRLHLEITPPIDLPRDGKGRIDLNGSLTMMNAIIEGWVREHPEQYLWLHDRWKLYPEDAA